MTSQTKAAPAWRGELTQWLAPLLESMTTVQRRWADVYVLGILATSGRKSVRKLAQRVAPQDSAQLNHFVSDSTWALEPVEEALHRRLLPATSAPWLFLALSGFKRRGSQAAGVAMQKCGRPRLERCQSFLTLTGIWRSGSWPLARRLLLPAEWKRDPARCVRAGIPERARREDPHGVAIRLIQGALDATPRAGLLLDRETVQLCSRRLDRVVAPWFAEVAPTVEVRRDEGRSSGALIAIDDLFDRSEAGRQIRSLGVRVRVAPISRALVGGHLLRSRPMLAVRTRRGRADRFYVTTIVPPPTRLRSALRALELASIMDARLRNEVGLDQFHGRSWQGAHHHALLSALAYAFLETL